MSSPWAAIANGDGLFWSETFDREIRYLPFGGDASTVLLSDLTHEADQFVWNGEDLLWEHGTTCSGISHLDAAGTAAELIASGFDLTSWMGIHEGRLYVTDRQHLYRLDL